MNTLRYYLAAICAFTLWGTFSLVLKPLHSFASSDILFYRVFSCAIIMTVVSVLFKRKTLKDNLNYFKSIPKKKQERSDHSQCWQQHFAHSKLVFFHLCDESCQRTGNLCGLFGLPDHHHNPRLLFIKRQVDQTPMDVGFSKLSRLYFVVLCQYGRYVLQQSYWVYLRVLSCESE